MTFSKFISKKICLQFCLIVFCFPLSIYSQKFVVLKAFKAAEARQGVAVDETCFYAISNTSIGKYDKKTGKEIISWQANTEHPLIHLDSGVIVEGKLYCAHSNYPNLPMTSSVEIWDSETMTHIRSISFGISDGSLTWIDRHNNAWWACFAHYNTSGGYPDKDNRWTRLVKYDDSWQELESWTFPDEVLQRFGNYSCSGGSWSPDGLLYCSGHDLPELYVIQIPKAGSVPELKKIVPISSNGQGIAWDRFRQNILYSIQRITSEIIVSQLQ